MTPSSTRRHLAVDVDGVLADFVAGFNTKAKEVTGVTLPEVATTWDWFHPTLDTREAEAVLDAIKAEPHFWYGLGHLPGALETIQHLNVLAANHDIYYLTNRPDGAKFWTEMWLGELGAETPTVLVTKEKGKIAHALGIDLAIDDRPENCLELYRALPCSASIYLYAQPWNEWAQEAWRDGAEEGKGIRVVNTLDEVWEREGL